MKPTAELVKKKNLVCFSNNLKTFQIGALDQDKLFNLIKKGKEKTNKQNNELVLLVEG